MGMLEGSKTNGISFILQFKKTTSFKFVWQNLFNHGNESLVGFIKRYVILSHTICSNILLLLKKESEN